MKFMKILEIIILMVLIIVLIIFIVKVQSNGTKCIVNPLNYAVKTLSQPDNSFSCFCSYEDKSLSSIEANISGSFYVNPFQTMG